MRLAIRDQEEAGIDIVTDGEQSRQHFVHGILEKIDGIDFDKKTRIGIRDDRYDADCPTVTSRNSSAVDPIHSRRGRISPARTPTGR